MHRRRRNKVVSLKNGSGEWVDNPRVVRSIIDNHFINFFTSTGQRDRGSILDCVIPKVTKEMNETLTAPVLVEEIKDAALQGSKGPKSRWVSKYLISLILGYHCEICE